MVQHGCFLKCACIEGGIEEASFHFSVDACLWVCQFLKSSCLSVQLAEAAGEQVL